MYLNDFFSLWVDADSCPREVRPILFRCSKRLSININFVANRSISIDIEKYRFCKMIIVEPKKDSADNYIFLKVNVNDIVITRDIPFAARLVAKGITVINDRGFLFDKSNIIQKLRERDYSIKMANLGLEPNRLNTYSKKLSSLFANCLDRELAKKVKIFNIANLS